MLGLVASSSTSMLPTLSLGSHSPPTTAVIQRLPDSRTEAVPFTVVVIQTAGAGPAPISLTLVGWVVVGVNLTLPLSPSPHSHDPYSYL